MSISSMLLKQLSLKHPHFCIDNSLTKTHTFYSLFSTLFGESYMLSAEVLLTSPKPLPKLNALIASKHLIPNLNISQILAGAKYLIVFDFKHSEGIHNEPFRYYKASKGVIIKY